MNYKNLITYNLKTLKNKEDLFFTFIKFEKKIDLHKLKILEINYNKNYNKQNMNIKKLYEDTTDKIIKNSIILENIQENESLEVLLVNTLAKFNYILDNDFEELKENLLNLISNDKVLIFENKRYSFRLYKMFEVIYYHTKLLNQFLKIKTDQTLNLEDKGVAYSSNRNTNETINPIIKKYEFVKKNLNNTKEINGVVNLLNQFKKSPFETITYLNTIDENSLKYFENSTDKENIKTILKIKEILNSAEGIIENDFYHSMKFNILEYFKFKNISELGFKSQDKLKNLLNDILEEIILLDKFRFDKRDFNQKIQLRNIFNSSILIEKVTPDNKRKHPILDNPKFINEMRFLISNSLKKSQYTIKR